MNSGWGYALVKLSTDTSEKFAIFSVYRRNGLITTVMDNPATILCDSLDELTSEISKMKSACELTPIDKKFVRSTCE